MIVSMLIMGCVIFNAQYHIALGDLYYDIIPTSIDGCSNEAINFYKNL